LLVGEDGLEGGDGLLELLLHELLHGARVRDGWVGCRRDLGLAGRASYAWGGHFVAGISCRAGTGDGGPPVGRQLMIPTNGRASGFTNPDRYTRHEVAAPRAGARPARTCLQRR
jgi:hypothetical protein